MSNYDWVFWLNATNIALGVVVLLAVLFMTVGLVWEIMRKHRKLHSVDALDTEMQSMLRDQFAHSLPVPGLGLTMADGGEPVKPSPEKPPAMKHN
jgi:hypothetical protein